jgi:DNA-binding IclR family transcriptional regulator
MKTQTNVLKSADKMFSILEYLKQQGGKSVTELSKELDMPPSTIQVYLNTLNNHKFVVKEDNSYNIGLKFLEFGTHSVCKKRIFPEVKKKVEELAESTGELGGCFLEEEGDAVYAYECQGEKSIRTELSVGGRTGLHCTAAGKAILANLPEERIERIIQNKGLEPKTENTITQPEDLKGELEKIREQGHAYNNEESISGVRSVAAPVLLDDTIAGSISVAGPANRFVGERFEKEIPEKVKAVTNELELRLTYSES